ncbi:MAG: winged helix-turn-helix transcriptional regulator [Planctomycetia bacterium]|nr:MAG: winged helix-turn-helix transcriptional regulator [Planctomycetia bacterium]
MERDSATQASAGTAAQVLAGLAKLSLVLRHEAWQSAGQRGLTPTQAQILAVIAGRSDAPSLGDVARELAITPATTSAAVATLVRKKLVRKTVSRADSRAVRLTLTAAGRKRGESSGAWPQPLCSAVTALPTMDQAGMLRGLIGMIRSLQEQGAVPTGRMCVECRFFRPNEHPGAPRPHRCEYIGAAIADSELRVDCNEMLPAASDARPRLWQVFLGAAPLVAVETGNRPAP